MNGSWICQGLWTLTRGRSVSANLSYRQMLPIWLSASTSPIRRAVSPARTQPWRSGRMFPPRNSSIAENQRTGFEEHYLSGCRGKPRASWSGMKWMPLQECIRPGKSATGPLRAWTIRLNLHVNSSGWNQPRAHSLLAFEKEMAGTTRFELATSAVTGQLDVEIQALTWSSKERKVLRTRSRVFALFPDCSRE